MADEAKLKVKIDAQGDAPKGDPNAPPTPPPEPPGMTGSAGDSAKPIAPPDDAELQRILDALGPQPGTGGAGKKPPGGKIPLAPPPPPEPPQEPFGPDDPLKKLAERKQQILGDLAAKQEADFKSRVDAALADVQKRVDAGAELLGKGDLAGLADLLGINPDVAKSNPMAVINAHQEDYEKTKELSAKLGAGQFDAVSKALGIKKESGLPKLDADSPSEIFDIHAELDALDKQIKDLLAKRFKAHRDALFPPELPPPESPLIPGDPKGTFGPQMHVPGLGDAPEEHERYQKYLIDQQEKQKELAKLQDEARKAVDPEYAAKAAQTEQRAGMMGIGKDLLKAGGMAASAGATQAGGLMAEMGGGFLLGDPMTAAAMVALQVAKSAVNDTTHLARAVGGANEDDTLRSMASMTKYVSILGPAFEGLVDKTLMLSDAIEGEAKKLSQFSAPLANFYAQDDARRMFRDMSRADRFGQDFLQAAQSRQALDQSVGQLVDNLLPAVLSTTADLLEAVRLVVDVANGLIEAIKVVPEPIREGLAQGLIPLYAIVKWLGLIARNTRRDADATTQDIFFEHLVNNRPADPSRTAQPGRADGMPRTGF